MRNVQQQLQATLNTKSHRKFSISEACPTTFKSFIPSPFFPSPTPLRRAEKKGRQPPKTNHQSEEQKKREGKQRVTIYQTARKITSHAQEQKALSSDCVSLCGLTAATVHAWNQGQRSRAENDIPLLQQATKKKAPTRDGHTKACTTQ